MRIKEGRHRRLVIVLKRKLLKDLHKGKNDLPGSGLQWFQKI